MFSDNACVNILTVLLREHGVGHVVVCPGSRNAPIVRNFVEAGYKCHPVTDERSAGFYALGIYLATGKPVAVCVTSGSALLNLIPAIAEAAYRHAPIVVVSADRPAAAIGQLEGQTLPQPGAFGGFVRKCVNLPEIDLGGKVGRLPACNDQLGGKTAEHGKPAAAYAPSPQVLQYANRLVNEAMLAATAFPPAPVHINVPLAPPLFGASVEELPRERVIRRLEPKPALDDSVAMSIANNIASARRPVVVVGQCMCDQMVKSSIELLREYVVVLAEPLCGVANLPGLSDEKPDYVLYCGDNFVRADIREYLKAAVDAKVCLVSADGEVHDPTLHATEIVRTDIGRLLSYLSDCFSNRGFKPDRSFLLRWPDRRGGEALIGLRPSPGADVNATSNNILSDDIITILERHLGRAEGYAVHYANSTVVRRGVETADHYIYVNRGINGIEGSVSTAAGHSLATDEIVVCVTGDLSFFYDSNALWNTELRGNLRILLINDGRGGIFDRVKGMPSDTVTRRYIAAAHTASARGLCSSFDVDYLRADTPSVAASLIPQFLAPESRPRPLLLEYFPER